MPLELTSAELTQQTKQIHVPQGLIRRLFFAEDAPVSDKAVKITATKSGQSAAPYVSPKVGGKVMKKNGKTVAIFEPPLIKPKYETEADSILEEQALMFGDGKDAEERAIDQLIDDEAELKRMAERTIEMQCVSVSTQGKFTAKGDGVEEEFDYEMDAAAIEVLTGTAKWDDADSDPLADIRRWHRAVFTRTGLSPNALVLGTDAEDAFTSHPKVVEAFNKLNLKVGDIRPSIMLDENGDELPGVAYIGYYNRTNTHLYSYADKVSVDGTVQDVFPADKVVYGRANAGGKVAFAGITDKKELPGQVFVGDYFIKSYTVDDPDAEFLLLKSKPLAQPADVDGFQSAKVV